MLHKVVAIGDIKNIFFRNFENRLAIVDVFHVAFERHHPDHTYSSMPRCGHYSRSDNRQQPFWFGTKCHCVTIDCNCCARMCVFTMQYYSQQPSYGRAYEI